MIGVSKKTTKTVIEQEPAKESLLLALLCDDADKLCSVMEKLSHILDNMAKIEDPEKIRTKKTRRKKNEKI